MSCDYTEINWVYLGGKQNLIEVYKNLWGLVHSNIKVVWEQIGEKLECQPKEFGLNSRGLLEVFKWMII